MSLSFPVGHQQVRVIVSEQRTSKGVQTTRRGGGDDERERPKT